MQRHGGHVDLLNYRAVEFYRQCAAVFTVQVKRFVTVAGRVDMHLVNLAVVYVEFEITEAVGRCGLLAAQQLDGGAGDRFTVGILHLSRQGMSQAGEREQCEKARRTFHTKNS